jgi:hypothetical protein
LEASRHDWEQLSAAHQQLNFTLTQVQQENDRLRARRFQLELERGDRLQRIVDLEENHALEEDADAHEIERLTLLQNIAEMQEHVQEAEVQVAALQAIVALQPLPQYRHTRRSSRPCPVWIRRARQDHRYRLPQLRLRTVVLQWATRLPTTGIRRMSILSSYLEMFRVVGLTARLRAK